MPLLVKYIIPFFRKIDATTAYEYLEKRFDSHLRIFASVVFIFFHIVRMAIVIYLPTLAITAMTGMNPYMIALLIGALCVVYTFFGGMEGVIWSDVAQGFILLGGIFIAIVVGLMGIEGGVGAVVATGISGLIIAAIFAAFQSTVSSSLNSLSACFTMDVVKRFRPQHSEDYYVKIAKNVILVAGVFSSAAALYMVQTNQDELLKTFQSIMGLFGAPIAGVFLLGMFTTKANATGAFWGTLITALSMSFIQQSSLTFLYFGIIGVLGSFGLGYLISILVDGKKEIKGLTIHTQKDSEEQLNAEFAS